MTLDGLFIEATGPGEAAVVLVHGAPDRSTTFRGVVQDLGDCRVVVYDRRGYGRSVGARPPASLDDHAADLLAILETLGAPGFVIAHSFGSHPTLLAATMQPDLFAAVGLWEPPLVWIDTWPQRAKDYNAAVAASPSPGDVIEDVYRRLLRDGWDRLSVEDRAHRRAEGIAFQVDMTSELTAPYSIETVTTPVMLGYGGDTSPVNIEGVRWMASRLPDASIHTIEGAGHFACRTHPAEYAGFVRSVVALAGA